MSKKKNSVFVKNLKTFQSDFTGENREYRINNALWVFLKTDFDLTQIEWAEAYDKGQAQYGSMFATALLKANGHEVSYEEVLENTDVEDISNLIMSYSQGLYKDLSEKENDEEDDDEESPS